MKLYLRSLLVAITLSLGFVALVEAQQQPVQWNYSFDTTGNAIATYPGNVSILGQFNGRVPNISPNTYGGDPTGVKNTNAAWTSAINAANQNPLAYSQRIGVYPPNLAVSCPQGSIYNVSTQLLFPAGVNFYGNGNYNACQISLSATNATIQATGLISNQANGGLASDFDGRADDITVNMNSLNGISFYCASCQDHSGWGYDWAYLVMNGPCYYMDGTQPGGSTNTFFMYSDECWGAQTRTAGGDGILYKIGTYPPDISLVDVLSYTGHMWANYVHYNQMLNATGRNFTLEDSGGAADGNTNTGILLDGPMATGHIDGVTSQYIGNVINLNPSGTTSFLIESVYRIGGTNTLLNTTGNCGPAQTITDVFLPFYVCGPSAYANVTDFHVGPEISYNSTKLQVSPDSNANAPTIQIYPAAGATGGATRAGTQMWDLSNNGWSVYNFADGGDALNFDSVAAGAATTRVQVLYPQGAIKANGGIVSGGSAPTGSGTCTRGAQIGGNTVGTIILTCTAQTLTLTFAQTAPNGWVCRLADRTTPADTILEASSTTTSWTSQSSTTATTDTVSFMCMAY